MADVFLSYASEDRERARRVAHALEVAGWSVWWDRKIVTGRSFDRVIEHEIETAGCVVVLWSRHSIVSEWVRNEAAAAAERDVLVPATIDAVKPPLEFRRKQTADLIGWDGSSSEGFEALRDGVASLVRPPDRASAARSSPLPSAVLGSTGPAPRGLPWRHPWVLLASGAIVIAASVPVVRQVVVGSVGGSSNRDTQMVAKPPIPSSGALELPELEARLQRANIRLSTGNEADLARVRGYFTGPRAPYALLAESTLELLGDRRLRDTGYLDMIDKWYTRLGEGKGYVGADGRLDQGRLKAAIVRANNDYNTRQDVSFEQVVAANP
jgi:hypothetical protein